MRPLLALLFAAVTALAEGPRTPERDLSRPPVHLRYIVGTVPTAEGADIYWESTNELVEPVRTVLFRTRLAADGGLRASTTVVRESIGFHPTAVSSTASAVLALWRAEDAALVASPLVDGRLRYPDGKHVTFFGDFPSIGCGDTDCLAVWHLSGTMMAAVLDADANVVSGPFALPQGWAPARILLNEHGIFFIRHTHGAVRAALVRRDGTVQYDVAVLQTVPLQLGQTPFGVASDGSQHVVAFAEKTANEIRAVRIAADGSVSAPVKLRDVDPRGFDVASLSLAWNGETYLLAGGQVLTAFSFLLRLDADLAPLPTEVPDTLRGSPGVRVLGRDFLVSADDGTRPTVFLVTADGRVTPPVALHEPPRRRAVR